jgi:hypothetical protein
VASLEAQPLHHWARAVAGNSNLWIPAVFAMPPTGPAQRAADVQPESESRRADRIPPEQLVRIFYGTASPIARRLASMLAAVPLTLPVMRLVQRALLPESRQVHLAEVWLSGLIERPLHVDAATPADNFEYFFVSGVRELLLNNLRLGEVIDVLSAVSGYIGDRLGQPVDFEALVADPQASGKVQIAPGYQSFARVAATALHKFGGHYAALAQRLEVSVYGEPVPHVEPSQAVTIEQPTEQPSGQAARRTEKVRVRALLVGTNAHASNHVGQLAGAENDLQLTRTWLQNEGGVASGDIVVLSGAQATKAAVMSEWRRIAASVSEGDQLFFLFSGFDQQVVCADPSEADGLEETLIVYDSVPGDRTTLLTHKDLADLAAEVEQRGGTNVLLLDSCRTASGVLARKALRQTLVFAAAAESEMAYETSFSNKSYGAVTYFVAEAMKANRPGITWLDVYDHVLANVRARGFQQTPQLIGAGDLTVFGSDRKPVRPYLVVTKTSEREIEVFGAAALFQQSGERGAKLALYPPGSAMEEAPLGFARVTRLTASGAAAELDAAITVPLGSRVLIQEHGDERTLLRVGINDAVRKRIGTSLAAMFEPLDAGHLHLSVSLDGRTGIIQDRDGRELWREPDEPSLSAQARANRVRLVLEHLATYLRTHRLANIDSGSELAGKVDLELLSPSPGNSVTLTEGEPLMLRLRNRAAVNLYVSVWMLDEFLGIERIFPATTSCVLLGQGREVALAVTMRTGARSDGPTQLNFKVFASATAADLSLLSLPRLEGPFDVRSLIDQMQRPVDDDLAQAAPAPAAATAETEETRAWTPGGPVALRAKVWKTGMTLRVKFLNGPSSLRKRVLDVATEWTRFGNLRLELVRKGDAELRVSFDEDFSWSYVGTDCLGVPLKEATINLGRLKNTTDPVEFRQIVLHEFGHALGLEAAQTSPLALIPWNKRKAYEYYAKLGWDKSTVDRNIFAKHDRRRVTYGPADPYSIMYHPVPREATDGKTDIYPGNELSDGDKQFMAELYPSSVRK